MDIFNKTMRRIKEAIADKTEQAKSYLDGENKDVDKETALLDEVDELKKEYTAEEKLFRLEQEEAESKSGKQIEEKKQLNSTEKFASVIRGMVRKDGTVTPMTEGVNANGGYTVPQDIQTEILHFKETDFSFEKYISNPNCIIYVQPEDLSWYSTATNWSTLYVQNRIKSIEDLTGDDLVWYQEQLARYPIEEAS